MQLAQSAAPQLAQTRPVQTFPANGRQPGLPLPAIVVPTCNERRNLRLRGTPLVIDALVIARRILAQAQKPAHA